MDRAGASDILRHGNFAMTMSGINAIPYVIKYGKIVAADVNHKDKGYNTVTLVAPVTFEGKGYKKDEPGTYFAGVILRRKFRGDEITQKFHVVDVMTHKKGERNIGQAINSVNTDAVLPNFRDILKHVAGDVNIYESNNQKINYSITPSEAEYQITSDDVLDTMETIGDFEDGSYVPIDDPLVMEGRARSEDTIRELKNQLEELQKKTAKQSLEIEKLKTARKFDKKLTHGKVLKEKSVKPQINELVKTIMSGYKHNGMTNNC